MANHNLKPVDGCEVCDFIVAEGKTYTLLDRNNGAVSEWTLTEILAEINRDRSNEWTEYNCSDWREGLEQFTCYSLVTDESQQPTEELTPEGIQYVLPGAERETTPSKEKEQGSLW